MADININLAYRAYYGRLTVEEVHLTKKETLDVDMTSDGYTVLHYATYKCPIEVVEAILDKGVNIDGLSSVSIGFFINNKL
jgi:hypothetical protein